jgi:4-amino-4-deoxy-L-arabinose transferase-like glycosyltransferase
VLALALRGWLLYYKLAVAGTPIRGLGSSDVEGWLGIASHIARKWDYSYWLLASRSPLFPTMLAVISALGGNLVHAAIVQVIIGALTVVLGYRLALRLTSGPGAALIAGLIMAVDLASVAYSASLLSEPLFNLLLVAGMLNLVIYLQAGTWPHALGAGLLLALATLARPTTLYFWLALGVVYALLDRRWRRGYALLAAPCLAAILGWCVHNYAQNGIFTFSTGSTFNLLFLRALSAEHLATGRDVGELRREYVAEIETRTGHPLGADQVGEEAFWGYLTQDDPRENHIMRQMALERFLRYPLAYLAATSIGLARMYGLTFYLPRMYPLEVVYHIALYGAAVFGVILAWREVRPRLRFSPPARLIESLRALRDDRAWARLVICGLWIVYFTAVTLVSQTSALDTRMRTPLTAPLAILAGEGLWALWGRVRGQGG